MFKVGDRVKRTHNGQPHAPIGFEAEIVSVRGRDGYYIIDAEGDKIAIDPDFWELTEDTSNHHPHRDLIIAWAKGAEIEVNVPYSTEWITEENPMWHTHLTYRIKPTNPNADRIARIESEMRKLADELKELRDAT